MKKIAFVTTFCPHHREKTFEIFAKYFKTNFYFFSAGDEWYWQREHGVEIGDFSASYLWGIRIQNTRITPFLPFKLFFNNYDAYIKCINGKFALPATYLIAKIKRKPFILWSGIWMRLNTRTHRLIYPLTKFIYKHADAIVVYGNHVKKYLISEGIKEDKIFIAHHAVDNLFFNNTVDANDKKNLLKRLNIPLSSKIILYLGRLEAIKGIDYLIEAFSEIVDDKTFLIIAGTGNFETNLKHLAHEKGVLNYIRFSGYVKQEESVIYYSIAHVFVIPSVTQPYGKETWGLVVNEAFNQSVPVIASDAVGAAAGGLIEHGKNGYIFPEKNSSLLKSYLETLLNNDEKRLNFGNYAFNKISRWNNEKMVRGFREAVNYVTEK